MTSTIDYVAKAIYHKAKWEINLSYLFIRGNVDAGFLPFPIFTTASLLHRGATYDDIVPSIIRMKENVAVIYRQHTNGVNRCDTLRLPIYLLQ